MVCSTVPSLEIGTGSTCHVGAWYTLPMGEPKGEGVLHYAVVLTVPHSFISAKPKLCYSLREPW